MSSFRPLYTGDTFSCEAHAWCFNTGQTGQTGRSIALRWTKAKHAEVLLESGIVYNNNAVSLASRPPPACVLHAQKSLLTYRVDMGHDAVDAKEIGQ